MSATVTTRPVGVRRGPGLPRMVGLDGLRAVAVLAVVLYHADVAWLPGGFLGVDVFFVLSGFLITSLLLVEMERRGTVDFGRFYARRAKRLLPALFAVLIATALLVATIAFDAAAGFRRDLPGALFYYSNWLNIFSDTSYFEAIGRPPMLKHLWSLAVEEQFYLIWPLLAWAAYRWRGSRAVGWVALTGALLSTLAMTIGSFLADMPTEVDPSRLYFGTDTHSMGVLVGAALAVIWRPGRTTPVLARQPRTVITAAGAIALLLLLACFTVLGEYSTFLYRGGFLVVALISAVIVAAASHRGVAFGRWLGMRPMRWIGERSYGIYLWHWPLFLVTRPGTDLPLTGLVVFALRMALLLLVAEASYRWLELPVRRGAVGRTWNRFRAGEITRPGRSWVVVAVAVLGLSLLVGLRIASAPIPVADAGSAGLTALPADAILTPPDSGSTRPDDSAALTDPTDGEAGSGSDQEFQRALAQKEPWALAEQARRSAAGQAGAKTPVSAFGDSVLMGASPALSAGPFQVDLHAVVAESVSGVLASIREQAQAGTLQDLVILHTGDNGLVSEAKLRSMLELLSGAKQVLLVTVQVPRAWMAPNNRLYARVAADYPNVTLVDWAGISRDHREYRVKDDVHLTWVGATAYVKALEEAAGLTPQAG